jgi:predicted SAM-dependent methyltransferase
MKSNNQKICNICGGSEFHSKFRSSRFGHAPSCVKCGSGERQRAIRKIYNKIPKEILEKCKALQFSNDNSVDRNAFASFEVSVYGGNNSLDMMDIERENESYDWIVSNHVLEHVADDIQAIQELLRILTPLGVIHINIPNPVYNLETRDWGYPDPKTHGHYRHYGSDFLLRVDKALTSAYAIQVVEIDDITDTLELVYFISKSFNVLVQQIGRSLLMQKCVVTRGK